MLSILFISMMQVKQISDNEIYLLIKYIKSVLWRVAKRLSLYTGRRYLKVNLAQDREKWGSSKHGGNEHSGFIKCGEFLY